MKVGVTEQLLVSDDVCEGLADGDDVTLNVAVRVAVAEDDGVALADGLTNALIVPSFAPRYRAPSGPTAGED